MASVSNNIRQDSVCCYDVVPMEYQSFKSDGIIKRCTGCHYDEENHEVVVDFEDYNLFQAVQECIPLAGVECMKSLLKQGKAKIEDFFDTGKNGVDTTRIPGSVHEANSLANSESDKIAALAKVLGLKDGKDYSAADLEDALTDRIKSIWLAQQSQKTEGDNK